MLNNRRLPLAGAVAAACGALLLIAPGCQSIPPVSDQSIVASAAAAIGDEDRGLADSLVLRINGDPVDVTAGMTDGPLSLADATRLALRADPRIQAALARVRIALADARQVRLLPNPVISVALRLPTAGGKPEIDAGLTQDFISLLQRHGKAQAADSRLRAAAADAVAAVLDALAEVQERYASVQAMDQHVRLLEARRSSLDRFLALARSRLQAGEADRLEALVAEGQRVELEADIADRSLERREERLALARLIGRPAGGADWPLDEWSPSVVPAASEDQWVAAALQRRPDVQTRGLELEALAAERGLVQFFPFTGSETGLGAEREDNWTLGPSVSLPLPVFDVGQARRERADAALVEARHNLTQTRRLAVEETRRAYTTLVASQANLARVRDRLVPLQQRRRDQAEAQFRAGQSDITALVTALLMAEQDLRSAQARQVDLERRTLAALVRLQRAVGGRNVAASLTGAVPQTVPATGPAASTPAMPGPPTAVSETAPRP